MNTRLPASATDVTNFGPATLYTAGGFGPRKVEVREGVAFRAPHAQYASALHVHYMEKGKRKPSGYVFAYKPYVLILAGYGHPDPADALVAMPSAGGLPMSRTRYSSFDDRYLTEFDEAIAAHVATATVILDERFTLVDGYVPYIGPTG
jgi:hypothetical protein